MSTSSADREAYKTLRAAVQRLDNEIEWRAEGLVEAQASVLNQRVILDELNAQRSALTSAISVHFPLVTL